MMTRRAARFASAIVLGLLCATTRIDFAGVRSGIALAAGSSNTATSTGATYNVRVVSDASPDLTDLESFTRSTTSRWTTSAEQVWALFYWTHILKRQTTPMVLHGFEVTDPIRNFSDYGFTQCSTISGINQSLYEMIGLRHQYWDICNHTVTQVEYDGKFHLVDSSFSNLVTTDDGVTLASLQEVAKDSGRLLKERSLYSTSPNGFLTGSDSTRSLADYVNPTTTTPGGGLWRAFCEAGLKLRDYYYNWDRGHRYVLNLRENESYTRYYRRLGTTPEYWVGTERVDNPDPNLKYEIDNANRFGIRGNGFWTYSPSLSAGDWQSAAYRSSNVASASGGLQPAVVGRPAEVLYKVQAANAITSQQIRAQFARVHPQATANIAISLNHGATWATVASLGPESGNSVPLTAALRNEVSGAYETLVRIQMYLPDGTTSGVRLTALTIDTITQVNTKALPKLNVGRNEMYVSLGDQSDTMTLWPELRGDFWKKDVYDAANIASQAVDVPRGYTAVVYPAVLTQDAHLTYRMDAPTDITRAVYGGRLYNFSAGSWIAFQHSFDNGRTWIEPYRLTDTSKPNDVIHYETITDIPAGVRTILFRYVMHTTSATAFRASGLYAARMEVNHAPATTASQPMDVTLRWKEVRADRTLVERSHRQRVTSFPFKYIVNIGGSDHPVMESMRLNVADDGDPTPFGYSDGIDASGKKYLYRKRFDGTNLAANKPYVVSRPPSQFQNSIGVSNTTVLTNGIVGGPATGGSAYWFGQCWTSGQDVDIQVDLGGVRNIGAVRAHLFGYPFWDALKGQVQDRVEVLTSVDGVNFESRGTLETSLWRKDVPINHMLQDDERASGWNFELLLPAQVSARFVRYRATPKRNLCISELQVLDRVAYEPFDIRIAPPGGLEGGDGSGSGSGDDPGDTGSDGGSGSGGGSGGSGSGGGSETPGKEVVLYAKDAVVTGKWVVTTDATAAEGARLQNPNAGAAKVSAALAAPADFFDMTFAAEAGVPYRLWMRGKATSNSWANDSVFVQFDGSVDAAGVPVYRIGTTSATSYTLEDCVSCGLSGWGWQDNGFGAGVFGPVVYFAASGSQRIRVQVREDGLAIDQIVLSAERFLSTAPGTATLDTTIVPKPASPNGAPSVAITAPTAASVWTLPTTIAVTATASDADGTVTRVDFFANGALIGSRTAAPWTLSWKPTSTGTYTITAQATDDRGATATSPGVPIVLGAQVPAPSTAAKEVVLYATDAVIGGGWTLTTDATAAGGARLQNANASAPKLTAALASPSQYFDVTFNAQAGVGYRLWIRGKATSNSWTNDSVYVQFDRSVNAAGAPTYRIGTTSGTTWTLEDCVNCGLSGWGWQDNGFGEIAGTAGPLIYFATSGTQRLRVQVREDGVAIDQIVLSAEQYLSSAPGATKYDMTIVSK